MIIGLCHVYDFGDSTVTVINIGLKIKIKFNKKIVLTTLRYLPNIEKPIAIGLFGFT
jgi:hypothetical protein